MDVNLETIVVANNCSTHEFAAIKSAAAKFANIVVLSLGGRKSLGEALDYGITQAKATLIARLDADDIALPHRFRMQREFLDLNPSVVAVGSQIEFIDLHGLKLGKSSNYPDLVPKNSRFMNAPLAHPATMFRRDAYLSAGGYSNIEGYCEDLDLWMRLSRFGDIANLQEILTLYRVHSEQASVASRIPQIECRLKAILRNHYGLFVDEGSDFVELLRLCAKKIPTRFFIVLLLRIMAEHPSSLKNKILILFKIILK